MPTFRERTRDDWEAATPPSTKKPSQWEDLVAQVASGKVMGIEDLSANELRGARIGIGRLAKQKGLALAYRTEPTGALLVSLKDGASASQGADETPISGATTPKRGGRRPKESADTALSAAEVS